MCNNEMGFFFRVNQEVSKYHIMVFSKETTCLVESCLGLFMEIKKRNNKNICVLYYHTKQGHTFIHTKRGVIIYFFMARFHIYGLSDFYQFHSGRATEQLAQCGVRHLNSSYS